MAEHANMFFLLSILALLTILLIFGMRTFASSRAARERLAGEAAYRDLAARVAASDAALATSMTTLETGVAAIEARLAAIEKLLKDVQ